MRLYKILFLLMFCFPFMAKASEWVFVASNEDYTVDFYVNYSQARVVNEYVYIYRLKNLKEVDEWGSRSSVNYIQADCNQYRVKTLLYTFYDGHMGTGEFEVQNPAGSNGDWNFMAMGTIGAQLLDDICKRFFD